MLQFQEAMGLHLKLGFLGSIRFTGYWTRKDEKRAEHVGTNVLRPLLRKYIMEHKDSLDADNPRDVIDHVLIYAQRATEDERPYFSGTW